MNEKDIRLLTAYLAKVRAAATKSELDAAGQEYQELFSLSDDSGLPQLRDGIFSLGSELVRLREELRRRSGIGSTGLSDKEKEELALVTKLLDENLFTYHFQPIVRTDNGGIFAYEALMRAKDMQGISPFHILKYAELTGRLSEIEEYTFLNILQKMTELREKLGGRPVFINSLPNISIAPDKEQQILASLAADPSAAVIEMTENSEFDDKTLEAIKEKYSALGVQLAIDDYGSGYSNINNLLRYTPNYVKIDRSLMTGIENDRKKRHFVRDIIDFCHDNGIMALAEGVETEGELRQVILLGADLIQGFYTAMPHPELLTELPYEIRSQIKTFRQEREDGRRLRIYTAEKDERIPLDKLARDGYSRIRIPASCSGANVTVAGSPALDTDIHIEIAEGFEGRVTLDTAHLSNLPERPVIDIGEKCAVILSLIGENRFRNSGIRVPLSSSLTLDGQGDLDIHLGSSDYYGIGNDLSSANGELIFDQDGTVSVTADSHAGVLIGSGLGGVINIRRGRYVLKGQGSMCVCIGCYKGTAKIDILGCDMEAYASGAMCTAIGSMNGDADIHIIYSSVKCTMDGQLGTALGTIDGSRALINVESVSMKINMNADSLTAFGSLFMESDIRINRSSVKIKADGAKSIALGSLNGDTRVTMTDVDFSLELSSELRVCIMAQEKDIHTVGGRYRVKMGESEYDHLTF